MKHSNNFKMFFIIATIILVIGALFRIEHRQYSEPILIMGILLNLSYIIIGIIEVNSSYKIDKSEKIMWTVGFIFFGFITSIIYLLSGRRRIV